jgi:hypothetical protein
MNLNCSIASLSLRLLHGLARVGLLFALLFLLGLVAFDFIWPHWDLDVSAKITGVCVLGLFVVLLAAGLWQRRRLCSWRWTLGGYLLLAPVYAYLVTDDPVLRHPLSVEELSPSFPGAEKSWEALMRYGKNHPLGKGYKSVAWEFIYRPSTDDPKEYESLCKNLLKDRTQIEANWAKLAPERAWWAELNTFERIGDLTPADRWSSEPMPFSPLRSVSQYGCAIASLQAIDGHGDAAMDTLLPVLEVARKLEPSARTMVRTMVARIIQRITMDTAAFVLETTPVSVEARERLSAALTGGTRGEAGARRFIAVEYAFLSGSDLESDHLGNMLFSMKKIDLHGPRQLLRKALNTVGPFVYNPRRTFNQYGDLIAETQELAAVRQWERIAERDKQFVDDLKRPRFKNIGGALVLSMEFPPYHKVLENYWGIEDQRDALAARLEKTHQPNAR